MKEKPNNVTPGTPAPTSGIWKRTDGMEAAISQGDRLPPGREGHHDKWHVTTPTHQPPKRGK